RLNLMTLTLARGNDKIMEFATVKLVRYFLKQQVSCKKIMLRSIEIIQQAGFGERIFTEKELARLFGGTPARRYGLINKAIAKNELIQIRRGVYMLAEKYQTVKLSQFLVASRIVPNSYVSFESALSYHGWIPERVVMIISTIYKGRTRIFDSPLGEFSYVFFPVNELEFLNGVERQTINGQSFFMAKPLRALADYVYERKIKWTGIDFLLDGLRIEAENFNQLTVADFEEVLSVFRTKRILSFLQHLQAEIRLTSPRRSKKMINSIINDRFKQYSTPTVEAEENALKEILQEIILHALYEAHFFEQAIFHGGTCLRIVYNLPRFSEDLDFMLKRVDLDFNWQPYQKTIIDVCKQYGISPIIKDKSKMGNMVQKMFVKDNSIGKILELSFKHHPQKKLTIKLEIDINPPAGSTTELKFLDFPLDFPIEIQDLPSNFASKSHALLCRTYVKGRDWYDFLWYVKQKVVPNLGLLSNAINQQGIYAGQKIPVTPTWYLKQLEAKITRIDWELARKEMASFLPPREKTTLTFWRTDFFMDKLNQLKNVWE
ncbi:MAG: nucleotidyl transferase AbiEii/AbiGii toxin family protein, partial [Thiomargarita sp.]|nr:nucleotidyl transferase AbiEii/AbiGii toxin family protein [Thiomargarita sp.]